MRHTAVPLTSALSAALLLSLCLNATAGPMTRDEYRANKTTIAEKYKTDRSACDALSGNAVDICKKEAKGHRDVALAELESTYEPSIKHSYQLKLAKADADFAVAKEKCASQEGSAKDVCRSNAESIRVAAVAQAKVQARVTGNNQKASELNSGARKSANSDIENAEYRAAVERCNTYSDDVKVKCIADAKTQYHQE